MVSQDSPGEVAPFTLLVVSHDLVGPSMAGPGIRYWELACAAARYVPTVLAAPSGSTVPGPGPTLTVYEHGDWPAFGRWAQAARVLLLPPDTLLEFPAFQHWPRPIIIDGYDPHTLETLVLNTAEDPAQQMSRLEQRLALASLQCLTGDFFVCAGEVQYTWWLGQLEAHGRINPYTYAGDPALHRLLAVVPYGLPGQPLPAVPAPPPEIGPDDRIILWGGGLWEWLDPLTAIRAMPGVLAEQPAARLLFPGTRHPNAGLPLPYDMLAAAEAAVTELGLEKQVAFGTWVPRSAWYGYLARSDIGLSLHPDTVEARLAFRSRVLDYIWAGLPMVVTRGDETSQLVRSYGLGIVVDYEDVAGVGAAIRQLLAIPKAEFAARFAEARTALTWDRAVQPIVDFCRAPRLAPDKLALGSRLGNAYYVRQMGGLAGQSAAVARGAGTPQQRDEAADRPGGGRLATWMRKLHEAHKALPPR